MRPAITREEFRTNLKKWSTLPHVTESDTALNEKGEFVNGWLESEWWLLNIDMLLGKPMASATKGGEPEAPKERKPAVTPQEQAT